MTKKEKAICKQYSARDEEGKVHCMECPLVIDKTSFICKASEAGWNPEGEEFEDDKCWEDPRLA